jgi:hypothetical protein
VQVRTEAQHIKFIVELFDKCHETTQQYITFLQVCFTARAFSLVLAQAPFKQNALEHIFKVLLRRRGAPLSITGILKMCFSASIISSKWRLSM